MEHTTVQHISVCPDDLEDATMSIHASTVQSGGGNGISDEEGCIDSLGRYQPPHAKRKWNITPPMAFAALCASLANLARGFVLGE